jgi:hypothetical protein
MYRILLRLYPADYHARFASEMSSAFAQAAANLHGPGLIRFLFTELSGLLACAVKEWIAKLTSNSLVRARSLPDIRKMRPAGVSREAWFARIPVSPGKAP